MIQMLLAMLLVFSILVGIDDAKAKKIATNLDTVSFDNQSLAWDSEDETLDHIFTKKDKEEKKPKKKKKDKKKKP